jgi:hypothetical protein
LRCVSTVYREVNSRSGMSRLVTPSAASATTRSLEAVRLCNPAVGGLGRGAACPAGAVALLSAVTSHVDSSCAACGAAGRPARLTRMSLEDVNEKVVDSWRRATLDDARWELAEAHHALLDRLDGVFLEQ